MTQILCLLTFFFFKSSFAADLSFFKETYKDCDQSFSEIFAKTLINNKKAETFQFLYSEGNIKSFFIPATKEQKNLLILISGTHGIEGFVGSAIQRSFLSSLSENKNTAILMIHGFNLWGFKNNRRVNENNIDLNRSFIIDRNHFKPDDADYTKLDNFLNPSSSASAGFFSHGLFVVNSIFNILKNSMEALRISILKGQYSFPKGIFYGGTAPQAQELLLDQLITKYITPYKKVFLIDLHTGYGERAKLHILAAKSTDKNSIALKKVFNEAEIDFADDKNFYAVQGDLLTAFGMRIHAQTKAEIIATTFEFGTLDSQNTFGAIESLRRIILENQSFHNRSEPEENKKIKTLFSEMFYPTSPEWRTSILDQAHIRLDQVLKSLD